MEQNPKQQVVERIKGATNILVTVSKNPTVDQLAACIGLTLLLNKLGKHGTAVFSGNVPSTLEFLQPEKTLEQTTDSLRDFIIALDKSKADKLRYKVEDEVVRIFITPYRTSISEKDLEFSQGDFNVDVVVALGVTNKEDIDQAIVAHGRILHDAVVVSVTNGSASSDVGSINWHDESASSLSEMLVSISESFQSGLLDAQMATSFLTGIVSETDRFSNEKTTPKVMTMSAQLMAAGANQQLIATKLAPPPPEPVPVPEAATSEAVNMPVEPYQPPAPGEEAAESAPEPEQEPDDEAEKTASDGEIDIQHDDKADEDEIHIDDQGNLKRQEELHAAEELEKKRKEEAEAARRVLEEQPLQEETAATETPALSGAGGESYIASSAHKVLQPMSHPDTVNPIAAFAPQSVPLPYVQQQSPSNEVAASPHESMLPPLAPTPQQTIPVPSPVPQNEQPKPETKQAHISQPEPSWSLPATESAMPQDDTLASLEQAVHSPHVQPADPSASVDQARQAVQTASLDSVPRPEATQAVGAHIVDLSPRIDPVQPHMSGVADVLQQTATQAPDPIAPPPVPPPMMPQYIQPPQPPQV